MSEGPDLSRISQARTLAGASGLASRPSGSIARALAPIPDLLACTFNPSTDTFSVTYADLTSATVDRAELPDVGTRRVTAWAIDEYRRGVEIVLADGTVTSFSAEYPRYLRDREYRRWVDSRTEGGEDLGERVARRVRTLRGERRWTVAELARRAGMAAPNVHRVEAGRHVPSSRTVQRLAEALGVPLGRLVRIGRETARHSATRVRRP